MVVTEENDPCVIKINKGWVRGHKVENVLGGSYFSFQGMRYAKPPLGNLRFKAPQQEEPWDGIYDATKEGSPCVSPAGPDRQIIGSEDCLFINVYTNELPSTENPPKAVMFWICGGGVNIGSGGTEFFGPDLLLTGDVVVVTFNYRLGLLGLAGFDDPEIDVPGNAIMKDMVRALEWVQENIKYFNGDPNNVTIFGESSGGACMHLISQSEYVRGLYHKQILMSSTNFITLDEETYKRKTKKFAKMLGFQSENEKELYDFLLNQPAENLVEAGEKLLKFNKNQFLRTFDPALETPVKSERNILIEPIEKYLTQKHPNPKPTMFGSTSEDGMCHASKTFFDGFIPPNFSDYGSCVPLDILRKLDISRDSKKAHEIGLEIKKFYYGDETPSARCLEKYVQMQTDLKYRLTGKMMVNSFLKFTPENPVYLYRFSLDSPFNVYRKIHGLKHLKGACHGDELTYLFNSKFNIKFRNGSIEEITMRRMVTLWTNFAKFGDPNATIVPGTNSNFRWEPAKLGVLNHLDIGRNLRMVNEQPDAKRLKFWDELYQKLGIKL